MLVHEPEGTTRGSEVVLSTCSLIITSAAGQEEGVAPHVVQASLGLTILLQPSQCWDYGCVHYSHVGIVMPVCQSSLSSHANAVN